MLKCNEISKSQYVEFIASFPACGFFHQDQWLQFMERFTGSDCKMFGFFEQDDLIGVLPLVSERIAKGHLKGWMSLPFGNWAGVMSSSALCFDDLLKVLKAQLDGDVLVIHQTPLASFDLNPDSAQCQDTHWINLQAEPDDIWMGFASKKRNDIRRAEKQESVIRCINGSEAARLSWDMYQENLQRWKGGSGMVYCLDFFEKLFECCGENVELWSIAYADIPQAGIIIYRSKGILHYAFAFGAKEVYKYNPHSQLLWEVCKKYHHQYQWLDLGFSGDLPALEKFKKAFRPQAFPVASFVFALSLKGRAYHAYRNWKRSE